MRTLLLAAAGVAAVNGCKPKSPLGPDVDRHVYPEGEYPDTVIEVEDYETLMAEIARLMPGDYAVFNIGATWCGPCKELEPLYDEMAADHNGTHLFLHTWNGDNEEFVESLSSEEQWDHEHRESCMLYNLPVYYPTVLMIQMGMDGEIEVIHDVNIWSAMWVDSESGEYLALDMDADVNEMLQVVDGTHDD